MNQFEVLFGFWGVNLVGIGMFSPAVIEEQFTILLDHCATNALHNADSIMKRASLVYSKEMGQWLSTPEALEVKKMELEIESQFMNEGRLEFE